MRKVKSFLSVMLSLVLLMTVAMPAFASESMNGRNAQDTPVYQGDDKDLAENIIQPRVSTTLSGSIAGNSFLKSTATYYISHSDYFSFTVNWTGGGSIRVGIINLNTGAFVPCPGGSLTGNSGSGKMTISNIRPEGNYYLAVQNMSSTTITSCVCTISFNN